MEIWDLYDKNRNLLGMDHVRGERLPPNGYHLVVHVWIRNRDGNYLISRRAADRPSYPLLWECVGGSVVKGENSLQGALRETLEEVGIDLSACHGEVVFSHRRDTIEGKRFNDFMDVWLFTYNGDADLARATTKEVAETAWLSPTEIEALWAQGNMVPTLGYFFEKIMEFGV